MMLPSSRRKRAIVRGRRRLGWDTGTHPNLCECVDCSALYGEIHGPLCRCRQCAGYDGPPLIGPMTGFDLFLIYTYGGVTLRGLLRS